MLLHFKTYLNTKDMGFLLIFVSVSLVTAHSSSLFKENNISVTPSMKAPAMELAVGLWESQRELDRDPLLKCWNSSRQPRLVCLPCWTKIWTKMIISLLLFYYYNDKKPQKIIFRNPQVSSWNIYIHIKCTYCTSTSNVVLMYVECCWCQLQ